MRHVAGSAIASNGRCERWRDSRPWASLRHGQRGDDGLDVRPVLGSIADSQRKLGTVALTLSRIGDSDVCAMLKCPLTRQDNFADGHHDNVR